jgi:hypothetical protein
MAPHVEGSTDSYDTWLWVMRPVSSIVMQSAAGTKSAISDCQLGDIYVLFQAEVIRTIAGGQNNRCAILSQHTVYLQESIEYKPRRGIVETAKDVIQDDETLLSIDRSSQCLFTTC